MANEPVPASGSALAPLSQQARQFIGLSVRPNTRRAYASQLKQWLEWCEANGHPAFAGDPTLVANYLSARAVRGQAVSTLRTAVAAIKAGHDAKGLSFDSKAPAIVLTLRGIHNANPRIARQAEPIRGPDVLDLMEDTDATLVGARDMALLALGYVFALRRSELVALDLETQGAGDGVLRITARTMEVTFAIAKTSKGEAQTVAVPRAENAEAVAAVENWIRLAGIQKGEPIIRRVLKGGKLGGRLHPQSVANIVKSRVGFHYEDLGASPADAATEAARYSGHSLRVGFCVSAAEAGADLRAMATVSRHKSLTMPARYAQKAEQIKTSPHRLPGVGLNRS